MQLNLSSEQLQEVIAASILQTITGPERERIIAQAVQALLTPVKNDRDYYGTAKSPLESAFAASAEAVARKVMQEELAKDEKFMDQVRNIITKSVQRALFDEEAKVIENLSYKIGRAFSER